MWHGEGVRRGRVPRGGPEHAHAERHQGHHSIGSCIGAEEVSGISHFPRCRMPRPRTCGGDDCDGEMDRCLICDGRTCDCYADLWSCNECTGLICADCEERANARGYRQVARAHASARAHTHTHAGTRQHWDLPPVHTCRLSAAVGIDEDDEGELGEWYCYTCALDILHDLDDDEKKREWLGFSFDDYEADDVIEELEKARDKHG